MGKKSAPAQALKLIATFFQTGYLPVAPATWASFFILIIWYFLRNNPYVILLSGIITFFLGIYVSNKLIPFWGDDPRPIVIDEVSAMFLALSFIGSDLKMALFVFFLFRLFDVTKPPPIRSLENMHGGFGIMVDDLFAAFYARASLFVISFFLK